MPRLCDLLGQANALTSIDIAASLLDIVFPEKAYEGEELEALQKQVIGAIATSNQAWVFSVNVSEVLSYNGLPTDREALSQLCKS